MISIRLLITPLANAAKAHFVRYALLLLMAGSLSVHAPVAQAQASSAKRLALVIGNDAYQYVSKLNKAGNDASAMKRELEAAGFEVMLHRDLNYIAMIKAIDTLSDKVAGGDQVVVFYAGHGVQLKSGNYLLPTDIQVGSEGQIEKTAYSLTDLTDKLSEAKAAFTLVMIDACRDNPLKTKNGRAVGVTRGLSAIEPPKGQMVVYSASKGQQALDQLTDTDTDPNGVFTREFIKRMKQPGVRIEELMREVQDSVETLAKGVNHEQRPAIYNEARGNFYFFGPTTVQTQNVPADPETETWRAANSIGTAAAYQSYLKSYPNGRYATAANIQLNALQKPASSQPNVAKPSPIAPLPADDPEADLWREVKASGAREYLEVYLKQYPKGKYLALAKLELKKLDDAERAKRAQEEAQRKQAAEQTRLEQQRAADAARAQQQQAEQEAWTSAKAQDSLPAYASYLQSYPQGRYAALAQAAQIKVQRETAEREKQQAAQREREASEADKAKREQEETRRKQAADQARAEQVQAARMQPGKVIKDCADCPEMVLIGSGSFDMGSNNGESDEKPVHRVSIRSFLMGKTEVTQGQWKAVMGSNPSLFSNCGDDCPVERVSWNDVQDYVRKLSQQSGKTYRLPSEAEWEYACRAGGSQTYCGSDDVNAVGWYTSNSDGKTHSVAGQQANAVGLYDMSGNVWEWVQDDYHDNYSGAPSDGSAWSSGGSQRVLRGGRWSGSPDNLRSAYRFRNTPGSRFDGYGFRIARTL